MAKVKAPVYVLTIIIPNFGCSPGCISSVSHVAPNKPSLHPPDSILQVLGQIALSDLQVDAFSCLSFLALAMSWHLVLRGQQLEDALAAPLDILDLFFGEIKWT